MFSSFSLGLLLKLLCSGKNAFAEAIPYFVMMLPLVVRRICPVNLDAAGKHSIFIGSTFPEIYQRILLQ
jgi:hypothetical protein